MQMGENLERQITVEGMYINFNIVARTEYFDGKLTFLLKDKKNPNDYYLYDSKKPIRWIKSKISIKKIKPSIDEEKLKKTFNKFKGIISDFDIRRYSRYWNELDEVGKKY